jgi:hypothetical protein
VQIFNANLTLRDPTPEESFELERSQHIIDMQVARAYAIDPSTLKGQPE